MKVFKCDLCGKKVRDYALRYLYKKYITKQTKEVCGECMETIQNFLLKIRVARAEIESNCVKNFIIKLESEIRSRK